jgi:hypothetical protein
MKHKLMICYVIVEMIHVCNLVGLGILPRLLFALEGTSMLWDSSSIALTEKASRCCPTSMPVRTVAATRIHESKNELY